MPDIIFAPGFAARFAPSAKQRPSGSPPDEAPAPRSSHSSANPPPPRPAPPKRRPLRNLRARPSESSGAAAERDSTKREALKKLYFEVKACTACPLAASRRSVVFGAGNADAPLVVIGEAPGAEEDAQGLPFVGNAGRLLTDMLKAIGLDRSTDTFVTNVLKCRPP
ncbi:MAG: uracil-DNA glycosylase, partial [Chitinivibrionales bacterium]|nr:uracil-DNA glycosylase [Chitinivibrionales bacterium]